MSTILYGRSNCDTCAKARKWLDRFEIAHAFVDYRDNRQSPETLVEWKNQLGQAMLGNTERSINMACALDACGNALFGGDPRHPFRCRGADSAFLPGAVQDRADRAGAGSGDLRQIINRRPPR